MLHAYSDTFLPSQHCHCKRGGLHCHGGRKKPQPLSLCSWWQFIWLCLPDIMADRQIDNLWQRVLKSVSNLDNKMTLWPPAGPGQLQSASVCGSLPLPSLSFSGEKIANWTAHPNQIFIFAHGVFEQSRSADSNEMTLHDFKIFPALKMWCPRVISLHTYWLFKLQGSSWLQEGK